MKGYRVAIDYGTSYSAAAFHDLASGRTEIVKVDDTLPAIPSMVVLDGDVVKAGPEAESTYLSANLDDIERTPKSKLELDLPIFRTPLTRPTDAAAATMRILLDAIVTGHNGETPVEVRLTHPVAWQEARRARLVEAGAKAGIKGPVLVPEPVAAALQLATQADVAIGQHVAVYDFGAGTFDTAVLVRTKDGFVPVGKEGGLPLGGEDIDEKLQAYVVTLLEEADREAFASSDEKIWRRARRDLRKNVQAAKIELGKEARWVSIAYPGPNDLPNLKVTNEGFVQIVGPLVEATVEELVRTVTEAGLKPERVAKVYLAGGSSRIKLVEDRLKERFGLKTATAPDRKSVVALGAAAASAQALASLGTVPTTTRKPGKPTETPGEPPRQPRLAFYDDPSWPGIEVTTKSLTCPRCGSRSWSGGRDPFSELPLEQRGFVQHLLLCEQGHMASTARLAALERKVLEASGRRKKPRVVADLLGPVSRAVRVGDSIYAIAKGDRLVRVFALAEPDLRTAEVAVPHGSRLMAAAAGAVVVAQGSKAIVLTPDLDRRREFEIHGTAIGVVAGDKAAWVLSRFATRRETLAWFGNDHAMVSGLVVTRLPYTAKGNAERFAGLGDEWIISAAGPRLPPTTFELYDRAGSRAVVLFPSGKSKFVGFEEWQQAVVVPASGAPVAVPVRGARVLDAAYLDGSNALRTTRVGLLLDGKVVQPSGVIGVGVTARPSRSMWVLSRHGLFAVSEGPLDGGLAVAVYDKGGRSKPVHFEAGAGLPEDPAWTDDDDGVWITARKTGGGTRFLHVHPLVGKLGQVERSASGQPLGSAGGRLFIFTRSNNQVWGKIGTAEVGSNVESLVTAPRG